MPQAVVDAAELRRFASSLKRFNAELEGNLNAVKGQLSHLAESWRDREQEKFAEEFDEAMKVLARFLDISNQHIPFLMRKAERIDDYLQQR